MQERKWHTLWWRHMSVSQSEASMFTWVAKVGRWDDNYWPSTVPIQSYIVKSYLHIIEFWISEFWVLRIIKHTINFASESLLKGIPSNMIRKHEYQFTICCKLSTSGHQSYLRVGAAIDTTWVIKLQVISLVQLVVLAWLDDMLLACNLVFVSIMVTRSMVQIWIVEASALNNQLLINDRLACHIWSSIMMYKLTPITNALWLLRTTKTCWYLDSNSDQYTDYENSTPN